MGPNRIVQTVRDRGKIILRMFPKRNHKNCRNWLKHILIDTYVLTHPRTTDKIRHVVYYIYEYVHLQFSGVFATIVMVLYMNIDKI